MPKIYRDCLKKTYLISWNIYGHCLWLAAVVACSSPPPKKSWYTVSSKFHILNIFHLMRTYIAVVKGKQYHVSGSSLFHVLLELD